MKTTSPEHDLLIQRLNLKLAVNLAHSLQLQGKGAIKIATELTNKSITNQGLHLYFECAAPLLKATPSMSATTAVKHELRAIANHIRTKPTLHRVSAAKTRHYTTRWLPDAASLTGRDFQYSVPNAKYPLQTGRGPASATTCPARTRISLQTPGHP